MFDAIRSMFRSLLGREALCEGCLTPDCGGLCEPPESYWEARDAVVASRRRAAEQDRRIEAACASVTVWNRVFDAGIDGCSRCGTEDSGRFTDRMDLCVDCVDDEVQFTHAAPPVDESEALPYVRAELDNRRPR